MTQCVKSLETITGQADAVKPRLRRVLITTADGEQLSLPLNGETVAQVRTIAIKHLGSRAGTRPERFILYGPHGSPLGDSQRLSEIAPDREPLELTMIQAPRYGRRVG